MAGPMILRPADYRSMPWKNGQGTTVEIAVEPPEAAVGAGFLWRVSIATVGASGPFSAFAGYDRTIMLLEGAGMTLDFGAHGGADLTTRWRPVAFSGDWTTSATLVGGAVRDFNVMTDRTRASHRARVVTSGDPVETVSLPGKTVLIYGLEGAITVFVDDVQVQLTVGETFRLDASAAGAKSLRWAAPSGPNSFYLVEIVIS